MLIAVAIATCLLTVTFSLGAAWSLCRASAQGERLGGYLGPEPDVWCGLAEVGEETE